MVDERKPKTTGSPSDEAVACPIVGVGASAGGLQALRSFFGTLPSDTILAFVVLQHLDPTRKSRLTEMLTESTELPVKRAANGDKVERGHVYVIPEGRIARVERGAVVLRKRQKDCRDQSIDILLTSLALENQGAACGVLLSGEGSDGVQGLREIAAAGGLTFVQDPETAEHQGMPRAALDAGTGDFVASPEQLAQHLTSRSARLHLERAATASRLSPEEETALGGILGLIHAVLGMDFTSYKRPTVIRRIGRRAMLRDCRGLGEYLNLVRADADELDALFGDLLISVTQFFRDPDVFETLRTRVMPSLLDGRKEGDPIRVWVPACSTGEEVYSILITIVEALDQVEHRLRPPVTVFGTDASERAISAARAGIYPESICSSVSEKRLKRFFNRTENGYEVDRSLREMCVFARQDVTADTPFSRLDLVSMRNLLIYMNQRLQDKVLAVVHFALLPGGFLILGTSESPETRSDLFKVFDKTAHVYRRADVPSHLPLDVTGTPRVGREALDAATVMHMQSDLRFDVEAVADQVTIEAYAPPRVVIDSRSHILHFFGDTSPYLEHPEGRATLDLLEMAMSGLVLDLKEALEAAEGSGGPATRELTYKAPDGRLCTVSIEVIPLASPEHGTYSLVAFRELPLAIDGSGASLAGREDLARIYEDREQRLRRELNVQRARLRGLAEEKDGANQALRSANEEVRSSNEELQSINEELETAQEELQSSNEELITVNDELRQRNVDLTALNDDITNFLATADIPLLMLDRDLRVRRFTPQAGDLFHIGDADIGRPLPHIRSKLDVDDLEARTHEITIGASTEYQREVRDRDGRWYCMRIRPYCSDGDEPQGAVLSFVDIDELKTGADRISRSARASDALNKVNEILMSAMTQDEVLARLVGEASEAAGAEKCLVIEIQGDELTITHTRNVKRDLLNVRKPASFYPGFALAADERRPILIDDTFDDPRTNKEFVFPHGLRAFQLMPLIVEDEVVGVLAFAWAKPKSFDREHMEFADRMAAAMSLALRNARLFDDLQGSERALRESEQRVRHKLDAILQPERDMGALELADVLDTAGIQSMMEDFNALTRVPMSIIDLKGEVLVGVGWQDVCMSFHRAHPETCRHCEESDTVLTADIPPGEARLYRCKNGMWDMASPLLVGGERLGYVFTGQFFFEDEPPDLRFFREQAGRYGFDEARYLAAVEAVPRLSRATVDRGMAFLIRFSDTLSKLSYSTIKLARSLEERDALARSLREGRDDLNRAQAVARIGSWRLDTRRNELSWSDETHRIFAIPADTEMTYESFLAAVHPDDKTLVDEAWQAAVRGERLYDIEHRIVVDDDVMWVREQAELEIDEQGELLGGFGTVQDITERKRIEAEVDDERRRLREIIEDIPVGIALIDADGSVLEINQATDRVWGFKLPKAKSLDEYRIYEGFHHDSGAPMQAGDWPAARSIATGERAEEVVDIVRPDGTRAVARIAAAPIKDEEGQVARVLVIMEDVTREVERQSLMSALGSIRSRITGTFDVEEILRVTAEMSTQALRADSAAVLTRRDEHWTVDRVLGLPESVVGRSFVEEERYATSIAALERRPVMVDDAHGDQRADAERMHLLQPGAFAVVPLLSRGLVTGAMTFVYSSALAFTEAQTDFCTRLMSVVALAIDNALAYQRERTIADTLQEALLAPVDTIKGLDVGYLYRAASQAASVGGDFYDLFHVDDDRVALLIGDVSGKGVTAARLTSLLRDGVRAYAYENPDPGWVLEQVNKLVFRSSPVESFSTVFLAVLDLTTGALRYCGAGHTPAVVLPHGHAHALLEPHSGMVGAFAETEFASEETRLDAGDILVLYTDGITEARAGGELFGEERLLAALEAIRQTPVPQMPQRLLDEVLRFSGGELRDDTVILVVSRSLERGNG